MLARRPQPGGTVLRGLLRPHNIIWFTGLLSLAAWLSPVANSARGFTHRSSLDAFSATVLFCWYALACLSAWAGFRRGRRSTPVADFLVADDDVIYSRLTALAAVGVIYAWSVVIRTGTVARAFATSTVNDLSHSLPDSAGIQTLRYVSALSAALALHRCARRGRPSWGLAVNLVLLGGTAVLSSRLVLVMAVLIALFLRSRDPDFTGIRPTRLVALLAALFLVTTGLNYTRNAGYYEAKGVTNPLVMNMSEIVAYVGSPMQVSVGVADAVGRGELSDVLFGHAPESELVVPTYFVAEIPDPAVRYDALIDIADNLTTNSVLGDVGYRYGVVGLLLVLLVMYFAAALAGHLTNYPNYVSAGAGVLLYSFAETWRIYLFNYGIVHALLFSLLIASAPLGVVRARRRLASG